MDIILLKITLVSMIVYLGAMLADRPNGRPSMLIIAFGNTAFYTMLISSILTVLVWQA